MKNRKGPREYFEIVEGDETRRQCLLAFRDFCKDCFGEEQEVPLPGDEIFLRLSRSHRIPTLRKPSL
jgi:hypothetical protein